MQSENKLFFSSSTFDPSLVASSEPHGGEGNGTPLHYSCLEHPMDGGAWWAAVHGVAKSQTQLSDFTFIFHFHAFEKEMAIHSTVLAWRIPGTGKPGGLQSMGSHRVRHDWSDLAAAATEPHGSLWPQVDECKQGRPGFCWSYMERICQLEALRSTEDEESGELLVPR